MGSSEIAQNSAGAEVTDSDLEPAERLINMGRPEEALEILRTLISDRPATPSLLLLFLRALEYSGFPQLARSEAGRAVQLFPFDVPLLVEAGDVYMNADKALDAETVYMRALRQEPDNTEAIKGLSASVFRQGKHSEAKALISEAVGRLGQVCILMVELARQLALRGDKGEAEAILVKCLDSEPDCVFAALLLAMLHRKLGQWDRAAEYARQVLHMVPGLPQARLELAISYLGSGKAAEGLDLLEELCLNFPSSSLKWRYSWLCLRKLRLKRLTRFYGKLGRALLRWAYESVQLDEALKAQRALLKRTVVK